MEKEEEREKGVAESDLEEGGAVAGEDAGDEAAPDPASACLNNFLFADMAGRG